MTATVRSHGKVEHVFVSVTSVGEGAAATTSITQCETDEQGADAPTKDPFAYTYTGRHDHGALPELRKGGHLGALVDCIHRAKADSESYFKPVVAAEKAGTEARKAEERAARDGRKGGPGKRKTKGGRGKDDDKEQKRQKTP